MNQTDKGSLSYLFSIVLVAVLGGLLFGYDTAVISGAEKGLQAFFLGAHDFIYTDGWHGFTCASALIGCVIGSAMSGYCATGWGRKRSLILAGILFFISALGSMEPEFLFFRHGEPTWGLLIAFNIYPKEEFDHRLEALKKHVSFVNNTFKVNIKVMVDSYEYDEFRNDLIPFKDEKEGGTRCKICIFKRMKRLFYYAKLFEFPNVSTIMSISRNKDVNYISKVCERLESENYGIKFIHFDFKKNNGQDFGVEIGKEEDIYRQNYCGCEFSEVEFNE